ncbi:tRNA (uracil-5-)-methyltransferase related enzyme [Mycoplasmopsis californica]|uniref:23S rRNA (Uracil(1939)-C(5))-methyltransferase RlmD n=1 Tax=Mycoplasmopsis equigenitalium TaxID=114883 RepID=A0ABY5J5U6_9BACT|nr:23S rRNA (uracil(1939)-C(5))-methyltransferase RlmD [Mycoplasmopsis equigenitalium]UUD37251.1 23S rRNA (uracil(1939)-C(5))-methyltransferase RlmD [Mycoplasmopsis equigenitalium]VEU69441.1 tRNA (uracil-5-)-methyltransferase related enzyme [Mycoplasmopsis californica]
MFKQGQIIENVNINEITYEGYGAVRFDKHLLLVENALINENVDIKVYKTTSKISYARVIRFNKISNDRVVDADSALLASGAAPLSNISYDKQLAFKQNFVKMLFRRQLGYENVSQIVPSPKEWNYRNKITIFLQNSIKNTEFGLKMKNSNIVVSQQGFKLADTLISDFINYLKTFKISDFSGVESLTIRTGNDEIQLILNTENLNKINNNFAEKILLNYKKVKSLVLKKENKILDYKNQLSLFDQFGHITFEINPNSFYQVNKEQTQNIYNKIKEFISRLNSKSVLDLYCGIGTIGLYVAEKVDKILGIEVVPEAINNAKTNANLNKITNANFICKNASKITSQTLEGIDTIIVDPPRSGLSSAEINILNKSSIKNIIYLSCNPHTLVRDLQLFKEIKIKEVIPFDMFPQTPHIETLVLLERKA